MAQVEGKTVKVGDYVGFKSDIEQTGKIVKIKGNTLILHNPDGFEGDYLDGDEYTSEDANDCWLA
jgi:hypothetical protein